MRLKKSVKYTGSAIIIVLVIALVVVFVNRMNGSASTLKSLGEREFQKVNAIETYNNSLYHGPYDFKNISIEDYVKELQSTYGVSDDQISYYYYASKDDDFIGHNMDEPFLAASTIKLQIALLYYDKIAAGEYTEDSLLTYCSSCYEVGGPIGEQYTAGSQIPLHTLLEAMILSSDNTATQILINAMGSYDTYRNAVLSYGTKKYTGDFYSQNLTDGQFSYDAMRYLFDHQEQYATLIDLMKNASTNKYFKLSEGDYVIAHKYGEIYGFAHDQAIVYTEHPFILGVFSENVVNASGFLSDMRTLFEEYTLYKESLR